MRTKEVQEVLIQTSLKLAKEGKGCLFVIKEKPIDYEVLIEQDINPFNILDERNKRRLELLASHDGACIVEPNGNLIAYSVNIKNIKIFSGFGTRHSAAYTASLSGNIVIMSSEEDRKVKIFKDGKLILQIDSLEKDVEKNLNKVNEILSSLGFGTLGFLGATSVGMGISFIPGVIVFGSSYYILNKFFGKESNLT